MAINEIEKNGTTLTVRPEGRLDTISTPQMEAEIQVYLEDVQLIVMDLSNLIYISSSGLRMLLTLERLMEEREGEMRIIHVNRQIMKIFTLAGFTDILNIITD